MPSRQALPQRGDLVTWLYKVIFSEPLIRWVSPHTWGGGGGGEVNYGLPKGITNDP